VQRPPHFLRYRVGARTHAPAWRRVSTPSAGRHASGLAARPPGTLDDPFGDLDSRVAPAARQAFARLSDRAIDTTTALGRAGLHIFFSARAVRTPLSQERTRRVPAHRGKKGGRTPPAPRSHASGCVHNVCGPESRGAGHLSVSTALPGHLLSLCLADAAAETT